MKITFECTPNELAELMSKMDNEEVEVPNFITGYDVEQYDATELNMNYIETYKGFKIYKSRDYYRWWKTENFYTKSSLEKDINTVHQMIDDHIIRLNR